MVRKGASHETQHTAQRYRVVIARWRYFDTGDHRLLDWKTEPSGHPGSFRRSLAAGYGAHLTGVSCGFPCGYAAGDVRLGEAARRDRGPPAEVRETRRISRAVRGIVLRLRHRVGWSIEPYFSSDVGCTRRATRPWQCCPSPDPAGRDSPGLGLVESLVLTSGRRSRASARQHGHRGSAALVGGDAGRASALGRGGRLPLLVRPRRSSVGHRP